MIHTVLIYLGGIETQSNYVALIKLEKRLLIGKLKDLIHKQLEHQYRFTKQTKKTANSYLYISQVKSSIDFD